MWWAVFKIVFAMGSIWVISAVIFNERIEVIRRQHRDVINHQEQELRRLRQLLATKGTHE